MILSFTIKAKFTRFSSVTKKEIEKCQGKVKDFLRGVGIARLDLFIDLWIYMDSDHFGFGHRWGSNYMG